MGEFSPWHLLIVAAVFVLLFGAKKLPDAARSLGRSARILKTELKDLHDDDRTTDAAAQQMAQLQAAPVAPPVAAPAPVAPPVAAPAPVAQPAPVEPPAPVAEAPQQTVTTGDQTPAS